MRADRYDEIKKAHGKSDEEMRERGVLRIHPAFRLVALAEPPVVNSSTGQWLNSELLSMFLFHEMRPLDKREEIHIVRSKVMARITEDRAIASSGQILIPYEFCCSTENQARRC